MSKLIASSAIRGAHAIVAEAERAVARAIQVHGADCAVGFPDTAYSLPVINSLLGRRVDKLADMQPVLEECRRLLPPVPSADVWLPYLGNTLDAGAATLFAFELIEACKYLMGPNPVDGIWLGAASDVIIRERGIEFVDGSAPGFAAVVGAAPTVEDAVRIARELQEKNLYVFIAGHTNGVSFAEQLASAGVQLGWETRLVPFGKEISAAIYALGFANRAALSFGGVAAGDYARNLKYNKNRIFAFVMALGEVTEEKYAAAAGAISYGFPTIADTAIPEILPTGICTYEHVVSSVPIAHIVEKCLEVRGCKIKITKVPIPVAYGPAFEGERITVVGPEAADVEPGSVLPLAIWVEVAGRKMQADFEPILERQIHHMTNGGEGVWHMGQRDIIWIRISKAARAKGFKIADIGEIIHAKFLNDYPAIVDKVQVTFYTELAEVESRIEMARRTYRARNQRLETLTDESVDTFYSCLLCQSFAPNHVCVITPERLGLCGAYNWLDGKAAYEIDPTGPNQPLVKGECIDPVKGQWANINDYVYANSKQTIRSFNAYSLLDSPMTSCGCFEAIVAVLPDCNGVMIVNREYTGDTPAGMRFSTLANATGGGQQTPGFIGIGKTYIASRKFIAAEGGHTRIVWMPRELKESLKEELQIIGERLGIENLSDMIADETVGTDTTAVRAYMQKVSHPALAMSDITAVEGTVVAEKPVVVETPAVAAPAPAPEPVVVVEAVKPEVIASPVPAQPVNDGLASVVAVLEKLREIPLQQESVAALQYSTAMHLLQAATNMLLMHAQGAAAVPPPPLAVAAAPPPMAEFAKAVAPAPRPVLEAPPRRPVLATISIPKAVPLAPEKAAMAVRSVTLGGSGSRTSAVTLGGAAALPFRHYEGSTGNRPVVAMEVFDQAPKSLPPALREAYGALLDDPAAMARHCVDKLGAEVISVRLPGTHPDSGDRTPEQAVETVASVLKAVGVPVIVIGPSHFEKNNAVMKQVASAFAGENLALNWVETDNYKTIAAAAMGYGHVIVAQAPIDVNMSKQLNILLTNMGVAPDKIIIDSLTGALGYGLEYTYSVMERIRTAALGGDPMLAMPILATPGFEVWRTKESKAPVSAFPQWGPEAERGPLLEISTAMALLNAGADLLVVYHPTAAQTLKRKIAEMTRVAG
jgi:acetyl-CoA synthase